jgi:CheY-like chemotaxis protein
MHQQLGFWQLIPLAVASGNQALALLTTEPVDLILIDRTLPRPDGLQLARRIRQQYPGIPLILLDSISSLEEFSKQDFSGILTKPVKQHQLLQALTTGLQPVPQPLQVAAPEKKLFDSFANEHPLHILIAEDYPINQLFAQMVLERLGYETALAENGLEVLAALQQNPYDVILMDVQMPEMDGLEATQAIREQGGEQPYIIAITASAMKEDEQACLQAGMNDYISKPIDLDDLMQALEKAAAATRRNRAIPFSSNKY